MRGIFNYFLYNPFAILCLAMGSVFLFVIPYLHELLKVGEFEESVSEVEEKRCDKEKWKMLSGMAGPVTLRGEIMKYNN